MDDCSRGETVLSGDIECGRALPMPALVIAFFGCASVNLRISFSFEILVGRVAELTCDVLLRNKARLATAVLGRFSASDVMHWLAV